MSDLPDFAKEPWQTPDQPSGAVLKSPQKADPLMEQISETHEGVQKLQVLIEPKEGQDPSKIDLILEAMETIVSQQKALSEGLDLMFWRLHELYKAMGIQIPTRPKT